MKRNLLRTFMVLLAIAAATIGPARGQNSTSTLTFTGAYGTYGATADDNVVWTVTSDGAESLFDATKGIHYGTGSANVGYIELSTSGITGTITQVVVNASTASGVNNATVSVTVGGNAFGGDPQGISTTATDYTFTGSASGAIVVRVAKPSAATKALYVKSIEVTYTPAPVLWPSDAVVYDFEAAAAAGENPANKNGSAPNGQAFYGWEQSGQTDRLRTDYKGYMWSDGSVLPRTCHVWRRSDRINGNVSTADGGLKCPSNKEMAIDSLTAGMMVVIIYDSTAANDNGSKQIIWAIGDGTTTVGLGHPRATATIGGVEAVTGVTPIRSGDTIIVTSVTPAANGTGYIVFKVKKDMVIKQIAVWEPPQPHTVRFASGNDGWTVQDVTASSSATAPAVLENVMAGDSLVVTAPATLPGKVKSVKAVKYVAPAATVTTAPTATEAYIEVGSTSALVNAGAANGGTMMYAVTTTNAQPASTADFSATIPTAQGRTAGTYYVWYYAKADAEHSDSEIAGSVSVTLAVMTTVTWNSSNVFNSAHWQDELSEWNPNPLTYEGITISFSGADVSTFTAYNDVDQTGSLTCYGQNGDSFTFTAPSGKKFCKIEIIDNSNIALTNYGDWTIDEINNKFVWSGTAATAVTLGTVYAGAQHLNSIVFTLIDAQ